MFGTIKTLPRAGCLAKLSSREKGLGQGGDQEPDSHSVRALEFLCGDRRIFQKDNHLCSTPPIRPLWLSDQTEATPQKKAHDSPLGVCQKAPKDSQTMRNKILWSDEMKIELA